MKTILVIEDDEIMRENMAEILMLSHYKVLKAESGEEGIQLAADNHPDLIICDIAIPETSGIAVLKKLQLHAGRGFALYCGGT